MVKFLALCIACIVLADCSVHPSQQDVSHRPTREIVEQILCETRIAIIEEARTQLRDSGIPGSRELADSLGTSAEQYEQLGVRDLVGDEKRFFREYAGTGIAFDFTLDAMEENTASTQVDFLRLISNGTASLTVTASNDLSRDSTRSFLVTRQFDTLLKDRKLATYCASYVATPNLEYPISGAIGIADVIHTFIDLNEGPKLGTKKDSPNVYTDKLTFITTIMGSVVPKVMLTPPTRAFHLTDASLTNTELRKDNNILTIGLAFAPHAVKATPPKAPRIAAPGLAPSIAVTPFARADNSLAEDRAVEAIYQQRQNLFFDRFALTPAR